MGGMELILIVFPDPPTVRVFTAITPLPFSAGMFSVASLMLNVPIGKASVPAVLEMVSVRLGGEELRLMMMPPPPETMELAWTVPPLILSVPVTTADPPLVRARRNRRSEERRVGQECRSRWSH